MFIKTKAFPRNIIKDVCFKSSLNLESKYFASKVQNMSFCMISVVSSPKDKILVDTNIDALKLVGMREGLTLIFNDITKSEKDCILFDEQMAQTVYDWVKKQHKHLAEEFLVVHCDAGISRSGAIATWASDYLKIPILDTNLIFPNIYIKSLLYKVSNMSY